MKLQNELLKDLLKKDSNGGVSKWRKTTGSSDYFNLGITDGYIIKFYNSKHFFVNLDCDYIQPDSVNAAPLLDAIRRDGQQAVLTNNRIQYNDGKNTAAIIETADGKKTAVNIDYFKYFESKYLTMQDFQFITCGQRAPIALVYNDTIHGIILPVKIAGLN